MKVWVVSPASATAVNEDKLRALASLDAIELTVVAADEWRGGLGVSRAAEPSAGYRLIRSRVVMNGRIGAFLFRDGLRQLRRARPDVVHAEVEPWSLAALQCVIAAGRIPLVIFTWENLRDPRRLLSRVIERVVLARAAFVIAGNRGAAARMLRLGVPREALAVLPQFGVDPRRYRAGSARSVEAAQRLIRPVVGYVGRLAPEKGVDTLMHAVAPLDARLLLVGDGPARADLERLAHGWPAGKATFAGAVEPARIPDYLACLQVLVLPSRTTASWAEQFGHVLIEAMAAGVPVIGSSSGAIPEVIGDAGLVFPEDDHEALRAQLAWVLGDETVRERLVSRGDRRVHAWYTNETVALAQRDIYSKILRRGRSR